MSLRIWLPLNGEYERGYLKNQGIDNIIAQNFECTIENDGKIGKCFSLDGVNDYIVINNLPNSKNISIAFWMKRNATTNSRQMIFTAWNGISCEMKENNTLRCYCTINGSGGADCVTPTTITADTGWVHVAYTFEDKVGGKLYINGSLVSTVASSGSITWGVTSGRIGNYSTIYYNGRINDFRLYDHVLSKTEIREISRGLICHFKLDNPEIEPTTNLITNPLPRYSSGNTSVWGGHSTLITLTGNTTNQPIPSDDYIHLDITYSTSIGTGGGFVTNIQLINVTPSTTYCYSAYIKSSNNEYVHANYLYIYEFPGDASNPGTRTSEGGKASKANREYIGDGWYRYWALFTVASTTNSARFSFFTYPNENMTYDIACWQVEQADHMTQYIVGNRNIFSVADSSGFGNNGFRSGELSALTDTTKYNYSTKFYDNSYISCKLPVSNVYYATYSFWVKIPSTANNSYKIICSPISNPTSGDSFWLSANTESSKVWAYISYNDQTYVKVSGSLSLDTWHHCVFVWNNGVAQWYVNGEAAGSAVTFTTKTYIPFLNKMALGNSYTGSSWNTNFGGQLSDFRFYVTALSAEDIRILYKVSAKVAENGELHAYKFNEVSVASKPEISRTGIVKADKTPNANLLTYSKVTQDNLDTLVSIDSIWSRMTIANIDGYDCYYYPSAQSPTWFYTHYWYTSFKANTTYTYSAWIYTTASFTFGMSVLGHFQVYNENSTASDKTHEDVTSARIFTPATIPANTWTKIRITFTTNSLANSYFRLYPRYNVAANLTDFYIRDFKLEEGGVATAWIPNENDVEYNNSSFIEIDDKCKIQKNGYFQSPQFIEM